MGVSQIGCRWQNYRKWYLNIAVGELVAFYITLVWICGIFVSLGLSIGGFIFFNKASHPAIIGEDHGSAYVSLMDWRSLYVRLSLIKVAIR